MRAQRKDFAASMDKIAALVRAAGPQGMRPSVAARALGKPEHGLSRPLRVLMRAGRLARVTHSTVHVMYYAPEHAPAGAEVMTPPPPRPAPGPRQITDCAAAMETLALLRSAGAAGARKQDIAALRGVTANAAYLVLHKLVQRGLAVNVRTTHKTSRYYLTEHAPAERPQRPPPKQRLTSVRDENKRLPLDGEPIITERTKVTRAEPFVDRRFTFDPPPGWRGQITRDWQARRLQVAKT